jgi:hypothetical protein
MVQPPPLAELLDLEPHPEGGWYRQTWRSPVSFTPPGYPGQRSAATAIYFLLHPGEQSRWHVVRSDELWLWHHGGPLELRLGGTGDEPAELEEQTVAVLGCDLDAGNGRRSWRPAVPGRPPRPPVASLSWSAASSRRASTSPTSASTNRTQHHYQPHADKSLTIPRTAPRCRAKGHRRAGHWQSPAVSVIADRGAGALYGVAATSAGSARAVGSTGRDGKLLILHWSGKRWT